MSGIAGLSVFPTISGGVATSVDLGPSILFTVLYAIEVPISVWRLIVYRRPARLIGTFIRLVIFTTIRVATFILRAVSATQYSDSNPIPTLGIFIAEQILLGIGFIVLVSVLLEYVKSHLANPDTPAEHRPNMDRKARGLSLGRVMPFLNLALTAAIALGIAAGAQYGDAIGSPSLSSQVRTERIASTALSLAITTICLLISAFIFVAHPLIPRLPTVYLMVTSALLLIVPAYRLATSVKSIATDPASLISTTTKVEFYILQATMEWLVTSLLLAVDARLWFGVGGVEARAVMAVPGKEERMPLDSVNGYQNNRAGYEGRLA